MKRASFAVFFVRQKLSPLCIGKSHIQASAHRRPSYPCSLRSYFVSARCPCRPSIVIVHRMRPILLQSVNFVISFSLSGAYVSNLFEKVTLTLSTLKGPCEYTWIYVTLAISEKFHELGTVPHPNQVRRAVSVFTGRRILTCIRYNKDGDILFSCAKDQVICAWFSEKPPLPPPKIQIV